VVFRLKFDNLAQSRQKTHLAYNNFNLIHLDEFCEKLVGAGFHENGMKATFGESSFRLHAWLLTETVPPLC
jgi:hypothetical protein